MGLADSALPTDTPPPAASGTQNVRIQRLSLDDHVEKDDRVAVEAPLEFQIHHPALGLEPVSFGTTMRTPGEDEWLAAGLLYGEGIINQASDINTIESSTRRPNTVNVSLQAHVQVELQSSARRFDQLRGKAQLRAGAQQRACKHYIHVSLFCDLLQVRCRKAKR